jgi:zinc transport system permease protein
MSRTLWQMMLAAAAFSVFFTTAGLAAAYHADWPAGATIIVVAGVAYLLTAAVQGQMQGRRT